MRAASSAMRSPRASIGIGLSRVAVSGVSGGVGGVDGGVSVGVMAHRNATNFDRIGATHSNDRAAPDRRWFTAHRSRVMRPDVTAQQGICDATAHRAAAHLETCQQENAPARTFRAGV